MSRRGQTKVSDKKASNKLAYLFIRAELRLQVPPSNTSDMDDSVDESYRCGTYLRVTSLHQPQLTFNAVHWWKFHLAPMNS